MTPKEKANELGNKFYRGNIFTHSKKQHLIELEFARQNAIICVDEIINYHNSLFNKGFKDVHIALSSPIKTYNDVLNPALKHWQEVKTEIEKL